MYSTLDILQDLLNAKMKEDWSNLQNTSLEDLEKIFINPQNFRQALLSRKSVINYYQSIRDLVIAQSPILKLKKFGISIKLT